MSNIIFLDIQGVMKISFDLDGVIAESHSWFFRLLNTLQSVDRARLKEAELQYYITAPLKHHPGLFLAEGDEGFIITARKPLARKITEQWLQRYGIALPVIFIDEEDHIDWTSYAQASEKSAACKAKVITELGVEVHLDNNPILVRSLRNKIDPRVKIVLVGGEAEFGS